MSAATASSKQMLTLDTAPLIRLASHGIISPAFLDEAHLPDPAPTDFFDDPDRSKTLLAIQSPLLRHTK